MVKCVVWDLDNTLWDGVLLEDPEVRLRREAVDLIEQLDRRGILHSVASRNDYDLAIRKLEELRIDEFFLYPQIGWTTKGQSVRRIAERLNLGLDALAFVDDDPFERDEVASHAPGVLCLDAADLGGFASLPRLNPPVVTDDARLRRQMYRADEARRGAEEAFDGSLESFLATLDMRLTIAPATPGDLLRAEELTRRTHQLNTTGYTFSSEELLGFCASSEHLLLMASLEDRYGSYGTIGVALVACASDCWTVRLLLMSCRVASRGVGTVMLQYLLAQAKAAGVRLRAEFIPNGRNRAMEVLYRFSGFTPIASRDGLILFEHDLVRIPPYAPYVTVSASPLRALTGC